MQINKQSVDLFCRPTKLYIMYVFFGQQRDATTKLSIIPLRLLDYLYFVIFWEIWSDPELFYCPQ
jgi:hypothetical protein